MLASMENDLNRPCHSKLYSIYKFQRHFQFLEFFNILNLKSYSAIKFAKRDIMSQL